MVKLYSNLGLYSYTYSQFTHSFFKLAGWAPYLYFHMLAERNSQSLARRVNSHRLRRQDTLTTLSDSDKETPGSSPNSNLIVEAMEAGRSY